MRGDAREKWKTASDAAAVGVGASGAASAVGAVASGTAAMGTAGSDNAGVASIAGAAATSAAGSSIADAASAVGAVAFGAEHSSEPLLRIDHMTCGYVKGPKYNQIVHDVSFTVNAGDFLCIIGANGCGKTISLKALMGLLPFEGGKITVCGNDLSRMAERQRARLHLAALELVGGRIEYSSLDRSASNAQFKMGLIKSTSAGRCFLVSRAAFKSCCRKNEANVQNIPVRGRLEGLKARFWANTGHFLVR